MKTKYILAAFAATMIAATASTPELREAGKKLADAHRDSVVWLSVLSKTTMDAEGDVPPEIKMALASQGSESKSEVTGTVIDSSGLVVTSLAGLDKATMVNGKSIPTQMGTIKIKASSEIKEVKLITSDGSEIPADLVLKDEDLGLAFVKVRADSEEAKGVSFKPVNLQDSAAGEVLDECLAIGRLDETFDRTNCLVTSEIIGKAVKPRLVYRTQDQTVGCPVFLVSGKLLGISVIPKLKMATDVSGQLQINPVVLPASDIAKVAEQAKAAKAPAAAETK